MHHNTHISQSLVQRHSFTSVVSAADFLLVKTHDLKRATPYTGYKNVINKG